MLKADMVGGDGIEPPSPSTIKLGPDSDGALPICLPPFLVGGDRVEPPSQPSMKLLPHSGLRITPMLTTDIIVFPICHTL